MRQLLDTPLDEVDCDRLRAALDAAGDEDDRWEAKGGALRPEHVFRVARSSPASSPSAASPQAAQAMTWNEWKTAQNDQVRSHFYLYLVANLRSDLPDARPFLRAVRDPYATIRAQEQVDHSTTRRVVLRAAEFEQAEHLELGVAASDGDTGVR